MNNDLFKVGAITSTHGIRGQVKVFPTTDDVKRFDLLKKKTVLLYTGNEYKELTIETVQYFKNLVILKFKEFNNINEIEKYKGKELFVTREQAVTLEEDEYFIADLIGLKVYEEAVAEANLFGTLKDVIQTGANDVYVIDSKVHGEVLIPAIKECVLEIDAAQKYICIHLMEGLI